VADRDVAGRLQRAVDRERYPGGLAAHHVNRHLGRRRFDHRTDGPRLTLGGPGHPAAGVVGSGQNRAVGPLEPVAIGGKAGRCARHGVHPTDIGKLWETDRHHVSARRFHADACRRNQHEIGVRRDRVYEAVLVWAVGTERHVADDIPLVHRSGGTQPEVGVLAGEAEHAESFPQHGNAGEPTRGAAQIHDVSLHRAGAGDAHLEQFALGHRKVARWPRRLGVKRRPRSVLVPTLNDECGHLAECPHRAIAHGSNRALLTDFVNANGGHVLLESEHQLLAAVCGDVLDDGVRCVHHVVLIEYGVAGL